MRPSDFASVIDEILPDDCHGRMWASGGLSQSVSRRLGEIQATSKPALTAHRQGVKEPPQGYKLYSGCSFLYSIGENLPVTVKIEFDKWGEDIRTLAVTVPEAAWAQMLAREENMTAAISDYTATHDAYGRLKISEGFGPVGAKQESGRRGIFSWQE